MSGHAADEARRWKLDTPASIASTRRYKEAVKVSTAILDELPSASAASHALKTRAKANEGLGFFKQALADAQGIINRSDVVSEEMMAMERRLKDVISANKAKLSSAAAPPAAGSPAAAAAAAAKNNPNAFPYNITVKATLDGETRLLYASIMMSYAELYEAIKAKFPGAGAERTSEVAPVQSAMRPCAMQSSMRPCAMQSHHAWQEGELIPMLTTTTTVPAITSYR